MTSQTTVHQWLLRLRVVVVVVVVVVVAGGDVFLP